MAEPSMTFWEHLEVLRWSIFRIAIAAVMAMVVIFIFMPSMFTGFVLGPTTSEFFLYKWLGSLGQLPFLPDFAAGDFKVDIISINVASQFMTHISTSFWFALVAIFPYIIYEIWKFIAPALYDNEKGSVRAAFLFGTLMFFIGCAISYSFIFPFTFRFLTEYQISEQITNQISLNSYMSTFLGMVFIMGLVFELPLLAWLLSKIGVLNREFLKKYRKHAVVILMILAALITPTGDPITLSLVFVPLYLLYEISICVVKKSE
ncbi:MAG: twin-arginine translocase subunit TatC [Bacteroidales bacterium]|nr:twin-arginine translocase subunit TatC [Bacteroidales bacterium]